MMKDRGLVDLHMHCRASDGTDTVYELLERVREAGITTFAVTDHDTIEGAVEMESIVPDDMNFIRGIEFSCVTDVGKCHILAYGYDKDSQGFRSGRTHMAARMKERCRRIGSRSSLNCWWGTGCSDWSVIIQNTLKIRFPLFWMRQRQSICSSAAGAIITG